MQRHCGLSFEVKPDNCQVLVSKVTTRNDQYCKKVLEVNQNLNDLCHKKNISIIGCGNSTTDRHLNDSKSHLNLKGNKVLTETFTEAVSNILH